MKIEEYIKQKAIQVVRNSDDAVRDAKMRTLLIEFAGLIVDEVERRLMFTSCACLDKIRNGLDNIKYKNETID